MMFKAIQNFFDQHLAPDSSSSGDHAEHKLRLAVAALLVEIAESDYRESIREADAILLSVREHFELSDREAAELIHLAEAEKSNSTDNFQFTRLINQHYSPEDKRRLMESLWRIAFADGELHHYEEHLIRRLADLLHVSHKDFIATKLRIANSKGSYSNGK